MRRNQKLVYCARNIHSNKCYIGWATSLTERKARHIRSAETGSKTRFHNAIRKHGANSFEWSILFDNLNSYDDCKVMERRMIALFDTYNKGYNSTLGGDGGFTGLNSGNFKKGFKPWNTGKKLAADYVLKLKNADRSESYKPVIQSDLSGNIIQQFDSVKKASESTGINACNIAATCRGAENRTQSGGFKWKYL